MPKQNIIRSDAFFLDYYSLRRKKLLNQLLCTLALQNYFFLYIIMTFFKKKVLYQKCESIFFLNTTMILIMIKISVICLIEYREIYFRYRNNENFSTGPLPLMSTRDVPSSCAVVVLFYTLFIEYFDDNRFFPISIVYKNGCYWSIFEVIASLRFACLCSHELLKNVSCGRHQLDH